MPENKKIDISSTMVEKGIDLVQDFLRPLIKPPLEELGLFAQDGIRGWRFSNQLRMFENAQIEIKKRGITTKQISLKSLLPLLDLSSLEEQEELNKRWVAMLVNFIDSKKSFENTVFPYILSQISTQEALALEFMKNKDCVEISDFPSELDMSDAPLSNLIRLGLIRELLPSIQVFQINSQLQAEFEGPQFMTKYDDFNFYYTLTELGDLFLNVCTLE